MGIRIKQLKQINKQQDPLLETITQQMQDIEKLSDEIFKLKEIIEYQDIKLRKLYILKETKETNYCINCLNNSFIKNIGNSNNYVIKYDKNNIYNTILLLAEKINNFIYNIYKGMNQPIFNYILSFYINKENITKYNERYVPIINEDNGYNYIGNIVNGSINVERDNQEIKNKNSKKRRKKKKYTDQDYEEIIQKTINNVINPKDKEYKKNIMDDMYNHNRDIIDKYLYYYNLFIDKRNNISKNDYKNILENVLNIKGNISRHNKIISIYKEMDKYKLFSVKL